MKLRYNNHKMTIIFLAPITKKPPLAARKISKSNGTIWNIKYNKNTLFHSMLSEEGKDKKKDDDDDE